MTRRDITPDGAPCWIELFTTEPDQSRPFYCDLFGWQSQETSADYGGYVNFTKDGAMVAGSMANDGQSGAPDGWSVYLAVPDIEAAAAAVPAHGGNVMMPPMQVMELGSMAIVADPGFAAIGMWQPGTHKGIQLVAEPGAPAWFELHTRAYEPSVAFYREVFTWPAHTMSDTPEFRYTTYGEGDDALAGIMDGTGHMPEGSAGVWSIYFAVADADEALAEIKRLGGSVRSGPDNTPFGRLAEVADPTGITFRIVAPNTD
ncbi:MAG: VOC family protein [Actinomycetota bacterium]|nr:VOC family protein [Actinomycetota bacterium]